MEYLSWIPEYLVPFKFTCSTVIHAISFPLQRAVLILSHGTTLPLSAAAPLITAMIMYDACPSTPSPLCGTDPE